MQSDLFRRWLPSDATHRASHNPSNNFKKSFIKPACRLDTPPKGGGIPQDLDLSSYGSTKKTPENVRPTCYDVHITYWKARNVKLRHHRPIRRQDLNPRLAHLWWGWCRVYPARPSRHPHWLERHFWWRNRNTILRAWQTPLRRGSPANFPNVKLRHTPKNYGKCQTSVLGCNY